MIRAYRQEEPEREGDAWLEEIIESEELERDEEQNLYCFICGQVITQSLQRIRVNGAHKHTFTNPGGHRFEIGCFRQAPGCEQVGEFTDFYSWFDGYTWSYAMCSSCRAHLGWIYRGKDSFFGLVLDRLLTSKEFFPSNS